MAPTIMERLRFETRTQHLATEALPFSSAILDGTITRATYAGQLAAYLPVHRAVEAAIADGGHRALAEVWTSDMRRTHLLEADLDQLGTTDEAARLARSEATGMASWIARLAGTDPVAILGVLYVLEGSTLGGAILRRHLGEAFGLTDAGLRYYTPYGNHPKPHWVAFGDRMNAAITDPSDADRVVAAACETFLRISRILSALSPTRQRGAAVAV